MSSAVTATDHENVRRWAESRGGGSDEAGILHIDFQDFPSGGLGRITWELFFDTFEPSKLAFLHQDTTESGQTSRFFKRVRRD